MKVFRLLYVVFAAALFAAPAEVSGKWWPAATETALAAAGNNRAELTKALTEVPEEQREGMQFLIENMPPPDLMSLKAEFLLTHVAQSYQDMAAAPWARLVPKEIFLNDVLPYASLNECRDNGRPKLRELAAPLVKDCKTPGEAAQVLNKKLFGIAKVRYSTQRKKPDQSALESMESGVATCSGLSILLADACRAVGVPARVAGTPLWTNLRGNHTWVEVWDNGWHFAGAAEPDGAGLDRGWFKGDAAAADNTKPEHRIYASSFKKTGLSFPLVWNRRLDWVPAVNVTGRYTGAVKPEAGKVRVLVRVLDKPGGKRVAAKVTVTDAEDAAKTFSGTSSDESADLNNILPFQLSPQHRYRIEVTHADSIIKSDVTTTGETEQLTVVPLAQ